MVSLISTAAILWAVAALLAIGLAAALLYRLRKNYPSSKALWLFIRGQGLFLFLFLVLGIGGSWLSTFFGPARGSVSENVHVIEFDTLHPSTSPVYREVDTDKYSHVTVFARTTAPQNGAATLIVYADRGRPDGVKSELRRIGVGSDSWVRWDQRVIGTHIGFVVSANARANTAPATDVTVRVYLVPR